MAVHSLTKEEHFQRHKDRKISDNEKKIKQKAKIKKAKYQQIIHKNVYVNK
jgi:hypothetical protein